MEIVLLSIGSKAIIEFTNVSSIMFPPGKSGPEIWGYEISHFEICILKIISQNF